jgi:hypothetical protein
MYRAAQAQVAKTGGESEQIVESLELRLNALPARESRLLDAFVGEQITQELYDQKAASLKHERIDLTNQLENAKSSQPVFTLEPTKQVFLQGSRATSEFLEADEMKKRSILENLLGNLSIENGKVAQVQYKSPYHLLATAPKNGSILTMLRD